MRRHTSSISVKKLKEIRHEWIVPACITLLLELIVGRTRISINGIEWIFLVVAVLNSSPSILCDQWRGFFWNHFFRVPLGLFPAAYYKCEYHQFLRLHLVRWLHVFLSLFPQQRFSFQINMQNFSAVPVFDFFPFISMSLRFLLIEFLAFHSGIHCLHTISIQNLKQPCWMVKRKTFHNRYSSCDLLPTVISMSFDENFHSCCPFSCLMFCFMKSNLFMRMRGRRRGKERGGGRGEGDEERRGKNNKFSLGKIT